MVPAATPDPALVALAEPLVRDLPAALEELRFHQALDLIWGFISALNKYVDEQAPWRLAREERREELARVMYSVLDGVRLVAVAISPFMPVAAGEIWRQLGRPTPLAAQRWDEAMRPGGLPAATVTATAEPIFRRIEEKRRPAKEKPVAETTPAPAEKPAEPAQPTITFDEFQRLDLRVARIEAAERIPGANKLLKLTVNTGTDTRTVVAGIALWYAPEELVGRSRPRLQPGARQDPRRRVARDAPRRRHRGARRILQPEQDVTVGSKVR